MITNNLTSVFSYKGYDGIDLSSTLMDKQLTLNLNQDISTRTKVSLINQFDTFVQGLLALGEIEHSGDWDPCYFLTILDPVSLEPISFCTGSGYTTIKATEHKLTVAIALDNLDYLQDILSHSDPEVITSTACSNITDDSDEAAELSIDLKTLVSIRLEPNE